MSARVSIRWIAALAGVAGCDPGAPLVSPPARPAASAAPSTSPSPARAAGTDAPRPAGLVLGRPGDEPRFVLGGPVAAGTSQRVRVRISTSAAAGPEGGPTVFTGVPGVDLDLEAAAASAPAEVALRIAAARATGGMPPTGQASPPVDAALVSLVNGALQPLSGLVAVAARRASGVGAGGWAAPWRFTPPAGAAAEAGELLANVHDALDPISLALPDEPLGVGARFTETVPLTGGAGPAMLVRTVTVERVDTAGATVSVGVRWQGTTGGATAPTDRGAGGPSGWLEGEGSGTFEVVPGRPLPERGSLTFETRRSARLTGDTAATRAPVWRLVTRTTVAVEPR